MTEHDPAKGLDPIEEGVRLFNQEYFFEAHEVLEDVWHKEHGEPRLFLQGLIQICAAYHHFQNGNLIGAATLLQRGVDKMRPYPDRYLDIDVRELLARVDEDRARIERMRDGTAAEGPIDFPRIERH